jgi:hypothetical protein
MVRIWWVVTVLAAILVIVIVSVVLQRVLRDEAGVSTMPRRRPMPGVIGGDTALEIVSRDEAPRCGDAMDVIEAGICLPSVGAGGG